MCCLLVLFQARWASGGHSIWPKSTCRTLHKHQVWCRFQWVKIHQLWCTTHEDKPEGDTINISDSKWECSTTNAFEHQQASNTILPPNAPLFAFETMDRSWSLLKWSWFLNLCNEIWCKEGMSSIKGHSFCIGRTMHLLLLGIDLWVMMVQGCWSSQAFLSYWHKCEEILSLFIGFSFQSHDFILTTMSTFKNHLTGK